MSRNWCQTYKGRAFDFDDLDSNVFDVEEYAHAISNLCRFGGHTRRFYSVAQHSVVVSEILRSTSPRPTKTDNLIEFLGLVHDLHEGTGLGDVIDPVKRMWPGYRELEGRVAAWFAAQMGITAALDRWGCVVKDADLCALMTEKRDLLKPEPRPWAVNAAPHPVIRIKVCMSPMESFRLFMERFEELKGSVK